MSEADVVVIGAGVMGTATAWRLARHGRRVVLLEQFEVGHKRGSSHGASRIFRFSYAQASYVRMAMEALPLWRELEAEAGEPLVSTLGGLDVGPAITEHVAALSECGADYELLDANEVRRRYPGVRLLGDAALFQPDAGIVAADRAVRAFARCAAAGGAEVREHSPVRELRIEGHGVVAVGERGEVRARAAVVTAGAWAKGLLAGIGYDLPVRATRETAVYFEVPEPMRLPTLVEWGDRPVYALPSPGTGIKTGEHQAGPTIDPDVEGGPDLASVARMREWVAERYPGAAAEPVLVETCLYTNTDDERFILDRQGAVVIGSACSGHGFKFAPLIGERLAALAAAQ